MTANRENGISFQIVGFCTLRVLMRPVTHSINNILAILLPIIFPKAILLFHCNAHSIFTISSGIEVQKATIVSQIIAFDIPYFFAKDEDPSTR